MGDDDFAPTVGEKSLAKLYDQATTLLAAGPLVRNVNQLKYVLSAMDLVLGPLSAANMDFQQAKTYIYTQLKEAQEKEGRKAIVENAPLTFTILQEWFQELNKVIDDNNLLFASSSVYQETYSDKYDGGDEDEATV